MSGLFAWHNALLSSLFCRALFCYGAINSDCGDHCDILLYIHFNGGEIEWRAGSLPENNYWSRFWSSGRGFPVIFILVLGFCGRNGFVWGVEPEKPPISMHAHGG